MNDKVRDPIIEEAERMHKHEQLMKKIEGETLQQLERLKRDDKEHRRNVFGILLGIFFIAAVIATIVVTVAINGDRDRKDQLRQEEIQQETARTCIEEGNIWVDGDCLLTRREP